MNSLLKLLSGIILLLLITNLSGQSTSAVVEYESTNKGILIPRMTPNQWISIANPAEGLMVYDSVNHSFYFFNGDNWQTFNTGPKGDKGKGIISITSADNMNGSFNLKFALSDGTEKTITTPVLTGPKGEDGAVGDKGPAGDMEQTGDKGPVGDKGAIGDKGLIGDKGIVGDKGVVGDKGLVGDMGPAGNQGPVGDKGAAGDKGGVGDLGAVGNQGPVGNKGAEGDKGATGDKGLVGDMGLIGNQGPVGDKGAVGEKGLVGDMGAIGNQGPEGDKGATGDKGLVGDMGPIGNQGPVGDKGAIGDKGLDGDMGLIGNQGPVGDKGAEGDKGLVGDKGAEGDKGVVGDKGMVGDKGATGDKGASGEEIDAPFAIVDDSLRLNYDGPLTISNDSLGLNLRTPLSVTGDSLGLNINGPLAIEDDSLNLNIKAPLAIINDSLQIDTTGIAAGKVLKFDGSNWVAGDVTIQATAFNTGNQLSFDIRDPYQTVNYVICLFGTFPSRNNFGNGSIGEIVMFGGNFAPRSWAICAGQLQAISSNTALFSILGTTYGGDGRTTFGLPDLRGRSAVGEGRGPGLSEYRLGSKGGRESATLSILNLPSHNHLITTTVN